mgnify:FL=1
MLRKTNTNRDFTWRYNGIREWRLADVRYLSEEWTWVEMCGDPRPDSLDPRHCPPSSCLVRTRSLISCVIERRRRNAAAPVRTGTRKQTWSATTDSCWIPDGQANVRELANAGAKVDAKKMIYWITVKNKKWRNRKFHQRIAEVTF